MTHFSPAPRVIDGDEPLMDVDVPLTDFEQRIIGDLDVLGMMYNGSLGRGEMDRCSDLDMTLWLSDEAFAKSGRIEYYLGWLGEIHFVNVSQHEFGLSCNSFVGPDWQRIELGIMNAHHPTPHPYFYRARVIKDSDERLVSLVTASGPPTAQLTRDAARKVIEETIYHIGFVTMQNIRGSHRHAMNNLCELADSVYILLAQVRGREGYAERFVERFLRPDETALLNATWPIYADREAIRRAARGLWEWTRYVWKEAEQMLGEALDISLDTAAFIEAIERPYAWDNAGAHEDERTLPKHK